jgi:hypothetical protein
MSAALRHALQRLVDLAVNTPGAGCYCNILRPGIECAYCEAREALEATRLELVEKEEK